MPAHQRRRRWRSALTSAVAAVAVVAAACVPPDDGGSPSPSPGERPVTLGNGGVYGNGSARGASTSADGTWTAFSSAASNLVPGDTNGVEDVFLRNNVTGEVTRIVEDSRDIPTISRNGRYIGFKYDEMQQRFGVHDRVTGTTTTWSEGSNQSVPVVTDDGTTALQGTSSLLGPFYSACRVRDLVTNTAQDCPPGEGSPFVGLVGHSGNGRYALYSRSDEPGWTVYALLDVTTGSTQVLNGTFLSLGMNVVTDDGSTIITPAAGPTAPGGFYDVATGTSTPFPFAVEEGKLAVPVGVSPDGRWVGIITDSANADPADTNEAMDMYRLDRSTGALSRVSLTFDGGHQLQIGVNLCGRGAGQVLSDGRVCVLDFDELSPSDQNQAADAYLLPPVSPS